MRQFLLVGEESAMVIDTGLSSTPLEQMAPYVEKLGLDPSHIRYILISHADFDHQGGNVAARQLFPHAVFICHHLDQALIENIDSLIEERYGEFKADHGIEDAPETTAWIRSVSRSDTPIHIALQGEAYIHLGSGWTVRVLHSPGHSLGHVSVWDGRSRTAIIADAVLGSYLPTDDGKPAFPPTYRYVEMYRQTIMRLQGLRPDCLLTSHYPLWIATEVTSFFQESMDFVNRFEEMVHQELAESGSSLTARDLIDRLSPRLGKWPQSAAQFLVFPLLGHIDSLEHSGIVQADKSGSVVAWRLNSGGQM